jgi:hypothetical protein
MQVVKITAGGRRVQSELSRFGAVVYEIMVRRGVTEITQLCRILNGAGHEYKRGRVSNWLHGRNPADIEFPRHLAEVFKLTAEERDELAVAFTFGQSETLKNGS